MDVREVFDHVEHIGLYVVDRETMTTLYENPVARKYSVKDRLGKPCYSIHGNTSMCRSCPIRVKEHVSFVNRSDLGMVFVVRSSEISWEGRPAYLLSVAKQETLPLRTEDGKSIDRMSRALQQSVDVYTEINMETMQFRQINIRNAEHFTAGSHGDYPAAFEKMCTEEILETDVPQVRRVMAPEALSRIAADSDGPDEVVARYRLKHSSPMKTMESRAIFMRGELPHYTVSIARDVTAEIMIQQQAHNMESILNNVSCGVAIYRVDPNGRTAVEYVNDGLSAMAECSKAELTEAARRDVLTTVDEAHRAGFRAAFAQAVAGRRDVSVRYQATTFCGNHPWVMVTLSGEREADGSTRIYGTFMDVTSDVETRRAVQEKYEVEHRRSQDDSSILAYAVFNLRTHATVEMERRPPLLPLAATLPLEAFRVNIAASITSRDMRQRFEHMFDPDTLLEKHREGIDEQSMEFQRVLPNGKVIWVKSSFHLIMDPGKTDAMLFYYCNDINLSKSLELMSTYITNEDYDMLGCINFADDSAIMLYGKNSVQRQEEYSGKSVQRQERYSEALDWFVQNAVVPEERENYRTHAFISRLKSELSRKAVYEFTLHVIGPGGTILTKKIRYSRYDAESAVCFFSQIDITDMLAAEEQKQQRLQQALAAAKQANAAKTDFLSRMSHDMRTPMNGILGLAALSEGEQDVETLRDNVRKIRESGDYLLSLINDTLDFQRIESGKLVIEPQIVETNAVLESILEIIRPAMQKKHIDFRVENENAEMDWYIRLDSVRYKQICVNLLSNAAKFTPEGGTITFRFGCLGRDGMISHDYISVQDNGIGMSETFVRERLFKPFSQESSQVSAKYAGSGLGLSIVKNLVELMGGRIEVQSRLGEGTTFTVYLDFERVERSAAEAMLRRGHEADSCTAQKLAGRRVLLVEDHPLNAEIARRMLQKADCLCDWAEDGQKGVTAFTQAPSGTYAAILMDIRMPVMNGLDAARTIRALDRPDAKTIPIIAMTANAYDEDVRKSLEAGMNAHLAKPIVPQLLFKTLAEQIT